MVKRKGLEEVLSFPRGGGKKSRAATKLTDADHDLPEIAKQAANKAKR